MKSKPRFDQGYVEEQKGKRKGFDSATLLLAFTLLAGFSVGLLHSHLRDRSASQARRIEEALEHEAIVERAEKAKEVKKKEDVCAAPNASGQVSVELWGDVATTPLYPEGHFIAYSAEECCRTCQDAKGCNTWVWCSDMLACGGACWLKRHGHPDKPEVHDKGDRVPWTSGLLQKDFDVDPAQLPPANPAITIVNFETLHGTIRVHLEPSWSEESVTYLRHLAANPDLCTPDCRFYRAEPGFLLQGSLKAYLPANKVTKPGPKLMERGDIGWAGGGPGPDWFVYLGAQPAAHFGTSHTVWGRVADEASFDVIEKIVQRPTTAPPGGMHMLDESVAYTVKAG